MTDLAAENAQLRAELAACQQVKNDIHAEHKAMRERIARVRKKANSVEQWIHCQSDMYLQVEDMGACMQRVGALREACDIIEEKGGGTDGS